MPVRLWNVVLAAGNGRRLTPVTHGTPKQYWRAGGRASLLEETFARIAPLAPPARTTVVVDRSHESYVETLRPWPADWLLYQPADRGTAVGVLLAISPIRDVDRDAILLLTPSDHGVADCATFRAGVRDAAAVVQSGRLEVALFGVAPSAPATDYGWITPGARYPWAGDRPLRSVKGFVEKPANDLARRLLAVGALWNTMVIVARVQALLNLYQAHLAQWAEVFEIHQRLPAHRRQAFLSEQYASLPSADFSRQVLTPARGLAVHSWGQSIGWSDLGTPDCLHQWLDAAPSAREAVMS